MHSFVTAVGMNEKQGVGVSNKHGSNKHHFFLQLGPSLAVSAKRPNTECSSNNYLSSQEVAR